jgi:hypothetical protein
MEKPNESLTFSKSVVNRALLGIAQHFIRIIDFSKLPCGVIVAWVLVWMVFYAQTLVSASNLQHKLLNGLK